MEHRIKNFDALATTDLRRAALAIAEAGYAAADISAALRRTVRLERDVLHVGKEIYELSGKRIHAVAIGKCAYTGALALEELLGERLEGGVALDVSVPEGASLRKMKAYVGAHPKPLWENVEASRCIAAYLERLEEDDLVLVLVSGGGSSLSFLPPEGGSFAEESRIFDELTKRGADIRELNTVRKHLSLLRGGGLAKLAYPAALAGLIVSDVPGDDISTIASAPTVRDTTTMEDAKKVLEKHAIPLEGLHLIETPKDDIYFGRVENLMLATSAAALEAMWREAQERGFTAVIEKEPLSGEASEAGARIAAVLRAAPAKTALLFGGETTVALGAGSSGKGGRNQELSLSALPHIGDDEFILPFASDGRDNTDAAGGICDGETLRHAKDKGLSPEEYLAGHRSFDFFQATGDALMTGPVGSNVSDLVIALKR